MAKRGTLIDRYFQARAARLAAERGIEKLRAAEQKLQDEIRAWMVAEKLESVNGTLGRLTCKTVRVAQVADWPSLYAWIKKTGNFEVLQKRIHQSHLDDVLAEHPRMKPGGVEFVDVVKVSATSARGKS